MTRLERSYLDRRLLRGSFCFLLHLCLMPSEDQRTQQLTTPSFLHRLPHFSLHIHHMNILQPLPPLNHKAQSRLGQFGSQFLFVSVNIEERSAKAHPLLRPSTAPGTALFLLLLPLPWHNPSQHPTAFQHGSVFCTLKIPKSQHTQAPGWQIYAKWQSGGLGFTAPSEADPGPSKGSID